MGNSTTEHVVQNPQKRFICTKCGRTFSTLRRAVIHVSKVHALRPLSALNHIEETWS